MTSSTLSYHLVDRDVLLHEPDMPYVLRFRDLPEQLRPRERLVEFGPKGLSAAELVAIVLNVGTQKEDVMQMARRIVKEYGEKAIMHETDPKKLATALDISLGKACQIVASFELGRRYFAKATGMPITIRHSRHAYEHLKNMGTLRKEQLRGLYLNSRYQVIHDEIISVGSLTANIVHPREVFQPAIEHGAVAVIIAHNHPSGSVKPTLADTEVTAQLVEAGKLLGIDLIDHLIITQSRYVSLMSTISPE